MYVWPTALAVPKPVNPAVTHPFRTTMPPAEAGNEIRSVIAVPVDWTALIKEQPSNSWKRSIALAAAA